MKIFFTSLFAAVCLFASIPAWAQYADAMAPRPAQPDKFIFYWGQQQCDLTAEQQYSGRIRLTPSEFRQMLLSTPKLWNGAGMVPDFTFFLQQYQVQTKDYLSQIAALDQHFAQVATTGQMLSITQLPLGNGLQAHIDIEIIAPKSEKPVYSYWGYAPFLNNKLLETVVWGQEEKFETRQRDFFTVSEFWQLFGQEPYIEWNAWVEPHPVLAELQILDAEAVTMALRFELYNKPYSDFVHEARIFQHLIQPGLRVRFEMPGTNYLSVNPIIAKDGFGSLAVSWFLGRISGWLGTGLTGHSHAAYLLASALASKPAEEGSGFGSKTYSEMMSLPSNITNSASTYMDWQIAQYAKYIRVMDVTARDFGIKSMFFLQPVPAVDKTLTPEESRATPDLKYGERYADIVRRLLVLRERNIEIRSLLDVFKDEKETIYGDDIHPKRNLMDSRGYSLLAARMAHEMAVTWGWRTKPQQ